MQRQHTGRPGTRVLPNETAGRAVLGRTMTAPVILRAPGTVQAWSDAEQQMVATPNAPYFDGLARIQAMTNDARETNAAEDTITVSGYLVTVPATVAASVDDEVVPTNTGDTTLDGRVLRVRDVVRGTAVRFERDLICTLGT
ncbi:hypothetical protein NPS01_25480 [Nocardioides psychrotolerans]|uniref:Uncharacterized protein n=1 Tax=Nocardioides psychrotolerans TaxID=1005945 RepID=A0A1I3LQR8_9ACTN|nr:DUF6093 family protein [Nocardioides psychrotolerans]GEP38885.1 hypothetical protein NPS01_25480 [Nocardioides psychrotolerans]SFI86816.1 hypothetical protein SAMN05216561_11453 [Nocardioides psychrotolerans]